MGKTFTHPILNRHTELCKNGGSNGPRYYISNENGNEPYDSRGFQNVRNEYELLALGFVEDKQEDWINKAYDDFVKHKNNDVLSKYSGREEGIFKGAILKYLPTNIT